MLEAPMIAQDVLAKLPDAARAKALLVAGTGETGLDQARAAQARLNQVRDIADPNIPRLQAIIESGNQRHEDAAQLILAVVRYVRAVPDAMVLEPVEPMKLPDGDLAAALVEVRKKIAAATIEQSKVKAAPPPKAEIRQGLGAYVERLVQQGKPSLKVERGKPFDVRFEDKAKDFGVHEGYLSAVLAWFDPEGFTARLEALVDETPDKGSMATVEQQKRLSALEAELVKLGFEEEAIISAAFAQGIDLLRRASADPQCVLSLRVVATKKAQPVAAAAE
jgi:hypothetical protein